MNIGIYAEGFISWGGGIDFIRNILQALTIHNDETASYTIFLLIKTNPIPNIKCCRAGYWVRKILRKTKISTHNYNTHIPHVIDAIKNIKGTFHTIFYHEHELEYIIKTYNIQIILPVLPSCYKSYIRIPQIGYIYDFQHEYLPHFFSVQEINQRKENFHEILSQCKTVIVNAQAVANDIKKFYPDCTTKIITLPFGATTPINLDVIDTKIIQEKYHLPSHFFLISNQFWQHKAHLIAFKALHLLNHKNIHIVCTGNINDYRNKDYFASLEKAIFEMNISSQIHFLGHIPKWDQIGIMKKAIAIIQPTLFEGGPGGGCTFDAVSIGTPAILSDIEVNLEIKHIENIFFFKTNNEKSLADTMSKIIHTPPTHLDQETIKINNTMRTLTCAHILNSIIQKEITHE
ncbi:MAG: Glycosyl transferase group 1 [candidate division TM6 bacterium GW2011_GWF2_36_6]|nr:MAG: Glycosyl transferase group 1 [candidate division TM6 bacterium GW2011_GWF2_36_6]